MEKILIVDDETLVRELLEEFLEKRNYHCTTASDAAEAREHLADQAFDLVITDIFMGNESGVDLAKYIKTAYADTGIIIITSFTSTFSSAHS